MHTKRIIPCLDVKGGRVVKGVNFVDLKDAGDPVEIGKAYDEAGADELVFLDITASSDARLRWWIWSARWRRPSLSPSRLGEASARWRISGRSFGRGRTRSPSTPPPYRRRSSSARRRTSSAASAWWWPLTQEASRRYGLEYL